MAFAAAFASMPLSFSAPFQLDPSPSPIAPPATSPSYRLLDDDDQDLEVDHRRIPRNAADLDDVVVDVDLASDVCEVKPETSGSPSRPPVNEVDPDEPVPSIAPASLALRAPDPAAVPSYHNNTSAMAAAAVAAPPSGISALAGGPLNGVVFAPSSSASTSAIAEPSTGPSPRSRHPFSLHAHPDHRASGWHPSSVPNQLPSSIPSFSAGPSAVGKPSAWSLPGFASFPSSEEMLPASAPSSLWVPHPSQEHPYPSAYVAAPTHHQPSHHQPMAWTQGDYSVGYDAHSSSSYPYDAPFPYSPPPGAAGGPSEYPHESLIPRQALQHAHAHAQLAAPSTAAASPFDTLRGMSNRSLGLTTSGLPGAFADQNRRPGRGQGPGEYEVSPTHTDPVSLPPLDRPASAQEMYSDSPEGMAEGPSDGPAPPAPGSLPTTTMGLAMSRRRAALQRGQLDSFAIWPPGQRPIVQRAVTAPVKPETDPELRRFRCVLLRPEVVRWSGVLMLGWVEQMRAMR